MLDQLGLGLLIRVKDEASRQLQRISRNYGTFRVKAQAATGAIRAQAVQAKAAFRGMRSTMMGGAMTMGAGVAMAAPFLMMGKAAASFEDQLGAVKSLLVTSLPDDQVEAALSGIKRTVLDVGKTSRISNSELMDSYYKLQSAIGDVNQTQAALKPTADLAVAGMGTMQDSVGTMTMLLNTYGKAWGDTLTPQEKALKIANILAGSIAAFNTDLPNMSQALQYAGGSAKAMGIPLSELSTIIGAAQTAGLKGTLAGTAFNAYLRQAVKLVARNGKEIDTTNLSMEEYIQLQKEGATAVAGKTASKGLADLGLVDEEGKLKSFFDVLEQLEKKFGITAEKAAKVKALKLTGAEAFRAMGMDAEASALLMSREGFGDEGSRMIAMLIGQSEALREQAKATEESENLMKMLAARQATLIAQWQMAKNRMMGFAISVGDILLPELKKLVKFIGAYIDKAAKWAEQNPETVKTLLKVVGAVSGLTVAIGAATIAWAMINAAFVATPIGWIVMGLAAIGVGIYMVVKHWDKIRAAAQSVLSWLWAQLQSIPGAIASLWGTIVATAQSVFTWLRAQLQSIPDILLFLAPPLLILKHWDKLKTFLSGVLSLFRVGFRAVKPVVISVLSAIGSAISSTLVLLKIAFLGTLILLKIGFKALGPVVTSVMSAIGTAILAVGVAIEWMFDKLMSNPVVKMVAGLHKSIFGSGDDPGGLNIGSMLDSFNLSLDQIIAAQSLTDALSTVNAAPFSVWDSIIPTIPQQSNVSAWDSIIPTIPQQSNITYDQSQITINVYPSAGMNEDALAKKVVKEQEHEKRIKDQVVVNGEM